MAIDPRRVIVMMTSNAAEVTVDLANRSSCVRILKHPPEHKFKSYEEGDLLQHVAANQPKFLGAVFAVIKEWHRLGKPTLESVDHDFRTWGKTLGFIVQHILGAGPLLTGHRAAQRRITSPGLTWLRDVALAVQAAGHCDEWLKSHQLLSIALEAGIETKGVDPDCADDDVLWKNATRAIGRRMSELFKTDEAIEIDSLYVDRRVGRDEAFRPRTEFAFFPRTPNHP